MSGGCAVESKNLGVCQGRPFWSGSVNLLDGAIEETHTYEEAEAADFHHSLYFSQAQVERMADGECAFFCINNGRIEVYWLGDSGPEVPRQIAKQIEFNAQPEVGFPPPALLC